MSTSIGVFGRYCADCVRPALMDHSGLCAAYDTSINSLDVMSSMGKASSTIAAPTINGDDIHPQPEELAEKKNQQQQQSRVMQQDLNEALSDVVIAQAKERSDLELSGLCDDPELHALRLLPRPTIELMLLRAFDSSRSKAATSISEEQNYNDVLGVEIGNLFCDAVEATRRKFAQQSLQQLNGAVDGGTGGDTTCVVRRDGNDVTISVKQVLPGDLLVLSPTATTTAGGDGRRRGRRGIICPVDCILLDDARDTVMIEYAQFTGSSMLVRRTSRFSDCPIFSGTNIIPQGSVVVCPRAVIAVAICNYNSSTAKLIDQSSVVERATLTDDLRRAMAQPLFLPVSSQIRLVDRHAATMLSNLDVLFVDRELVLEDDSQLHVGGCVWNGIVFRGSADDVWDYSDVIGRRTVHGGTHVSTFCFNPMSMHHEGGSRISSGTSTEALRRLTTAAMLTTIDLQQQTTTSDNGDGASSVPSSQNDDERWSGSAVAHAVKQWCSASSWSPLHLPKFKATSSIKEVRPPLFVAQQSYISVMGPSLHGNTLFARTLQYENNMSTHGTASKGLLLLVWGDASTLFPLCSFVNEARGQVTASRAHQDQVSYMAAHLASPSHLLGVAVADVLPQYVGCSSLPPISDLVSLIAQSQTLCFLGSLIIHPIIHNQNIEAANALRKYMRVGVVSTATRVESVTHFCRQCRGCERRGDRKAKNYSMTIEQYIDGDGDGGDHSLCIDLGVEDGVDEALQAIAPRGRKMIPPHSERDHGEAAAAEADLSLLRPSDVNVFGGSPLHVQQLVMGAARSYSVGYVGAHAGSLGALRTAHLSISLIAPSKQTDNNNTSSSVQRLMAQCSQLLVKPSGGAEGRVIDLAALVQVVESYHQDHRRSTNNNAS